MASSSVAIGGDGYFANNPKTERDYQLSDLSKTICSFHFVTGADVDTILSRYISDGNGFDPKSVPDYVQLVRSATIDPVSKIVRVSDGKLQAASRYYGDQGCVILPDFRDEGYFTPKAVRNPAAVVNGPDWPDGGLLKAGRLPRGYDAAKLKAAQETLFSSEGQVYQFAVVHKGKLLLEHYADGVTKDTPVQNWSMGKTIIGTMIGMLVQRGAFKPEDYAPVPEWRAHPDDLRAKIRIIDLMRMSSGLRCSRSTRPDEWVVAFDDDVYAKAIDITRMAITRPVVAPPNSRANYSNCDMQSLGFLIRQAIESRREDYLSWPYRNLYDKLGMVGMVSEVDPYGNFHLTGYDYGTARDWAKLGLLFLNDGAWKGERILPEGWIKLITTPAPAFEHLVSTAEAELTEELKTGYPPRERLLDSKTMYGGAVWLNSRGAWPMLPKDAFAASGGTASTAIFVPSRDLVVVILTSTTKAPENRRNSLTAIAHIVEALPKP